MKHRPTNGPYAMKVIQLGCSEQERKQILIEVKTLHKSHVPGIITFFDAFYADKVHIILEYMDCGSLAACSSARSLPGNARVSGDMLGGLAHLHRVPRSCTVTSSRRTSSTRAARSSQTLA